MKLIGRTVPLFVLLILGGALTARAQTNVSANFGVGYGWDSAAQGCAAVLTEFGYYEPTGPCGNGGYPTPTLNGVFGIFGADFMFSKYLGVGGEYAFKFAQSPWADVNYRPGVYDFNAIYRPVSTKRAALEIQGGLGGFDTKFYFPGDCGDVGCTGGGYINSADHFQIHAGVDAKIYVRGGIFIKPQFDIHYVIHLSGPEDSVGAPTGQFGSDWVPVATVSLGYTFGER